MWVPVIHEIFWYRCLLEKHHFKNHFNNAEVFWPEYHEDHKRAKGSTFNESYYYVCKAFSCLGVSCHWKKWNEVRSYKTSYNLLSFDIICINVLLFCQGITSWACNITEPLLAEYIIFRFHNCKMAHPILAADKSTTQFFDNSAGDDYRCKILLRLVKKMNQLSWPSTTSCIQKTWHFYFFFFFFLRDK